jgi:hypothetical protein
VNKFCENEFPPDIENEELKPKENQIEEPSVSSTLSQNLTALEDNQKK